MEKIAANASKRYKTAQSMVVDGLREAILSGVLEGGQPLRQEELAARFGVSRIPVREALLQLEGEGLIDSYPHRGAVVARLSYGEAMEIGRIRIALESLAIRLAIPNMGEQDLKKAGDVLDEIDRETDLTSRWGELNWRFHSILYAPANQPRLMELIRAEHRGFDRYLRLHLVLEHYEQRAQAEHRELLDLCHRGEAEAAVDLLSRHIGVISGALFEHFAETNGPKQTGTGSPRTS